MAVEIEKKYRLTKASRDRIVRRLRHLKAKSGKQEFEENTLYQGGELEFGLRALRLRRVNGRAILTFKERLPSVSPIKHQHEEETEVADPEVLDAILNNLGFEAALVYEKRRTRWKVGKAEVAIDELPFGLFMEIEASESEIARVENLIGAAHLQVELETYPRLTARLGKKRDGVVAARFRARRK